MKTRPVWGRFSSRLHNCGKEVEAMHILSGLGYGVLRPELKGVRLRAVLMRRKLEPVLQGISAQIRCCWGDPEGRREASRH